MFEFSHFKGTIKRESVVKMLSVFFLVLFAGEKVDAMPLYAYVPPVEKYVGESLQLPQVQLQGITEAQRANLNGVILPKAVCQVDAYTPPGTYPILLDYTDAVLPDDNGEGYYWGQTTGAFCTVRYMDAPREGTDYQILDEKGRVLTGDHASPDQIIIKPIRDGEWVGLWNEDWQRIQWQKELRLDQESSYELQLCRKSSTGGVSNPAACKMIIDHTEPQIQLMNIQPDQRLMETVNPEVEIKETYLEQAQINVVAKRNNQTIQAEVQMDKKETDQWNCMICLPKEDGYYEITVEVTDLAGNYTEQTWDFSISLNPPSLETDFGQKGETIKGDESIQITVKGTEEIVELTVQINGKEVQYQWNETGICIQPEQLAEGENCLTAYGVDGLGRRFQMDPIYFFRQELLPEKNCAIINENMEQSVGEQAQKEGLTVEGKKKLIIISIIVLLVAAAVIGVGLAVGQRIIREQREAQAQLEQEALMQEAAQKEQEAQELEAKRLEEEKEREQMQAEEEAKKLAEIQRQEALAQAQKVQAIGSVGFANINAFAESLYSSISPEETTPIPTPTGGGRIIAIDAGHQARGNSEREPIGPGASETKAKVASGTHGNTSGLDEYELNLQVSLQLEQELINRGYQVYMIRSTHDVNISNSERARMAADAGSDILVRIHANGSDDSSVHGALTMAPGSDNSFLTQDVITRSQRLSRVLIDSFCAATGARNLGVQNYNNMSGINWSTIPVSIVEMGFMTNAQEDLNMASADYQQKMVQGIANGIDAYYAQ